MEPYFTCQYETIMQMRKMRKQPLQSFSKLLLQFYLKCHHWYHANSLVKLRFSDGCRRRSVNYGVKSFFKGVSLFYEFHSTANILVPGITAIHSVISLAYDATLTKSNRDGGWILISKFYVDSPSQQCLPLSSI